MVVQVNLRVDDKTMHEIDKLIEAGEFDSRSAAIRYAMKKLIQYGGRFDKP